MSGILRGRSEATTNYVNWKSFRNQIAFRSVREAEAATYFNGTLPRQFPEGFFDNKVLEQLASTLMRFFDAAGAQGRADRQRCVGLALPVHGGKTTAAYMAAFLKAYSQGMNAIIVYPSRLKLEIAQRSLENTIRSRYYHRFPSLLHFRDDTTLRPSEAMTPQIIVCDTNVLHARVLMGIPHSCFWESLGLVVFEDIDQYEEAYGSNAAFVFRRMLAKLRRHRSGHDVLCTLRPVRQPENFIRTLVGVPRGCEVEILSADSAGRPAFSLTHWYPPVQNVAIAGERRTQFVCSRENYWDELRSLLGELVRGAETRGKGGRKGTVAVWWDEVPLSDDDISDIRIRFGPELGAYESLFVASSLDMLRLRMLQANPPVDWNEVSAILIVGRVRAAREYAATLHHVGAEPHSVVIYALQSPSMQLESCDIVESGQDALEIPELQVRAHHLNLEDASIIGRHVEFLREECPNIDEEALNALFPEVFVTTFISKRGSASGRYLFLNSDVRFVPMKKRDAGQLLESSLGRPFRLLAPNARGAYEPLSQVDLAFARVYCYTNAKLVYEGRRYVVAEIAPADRIARLREIRGDLDLSWATFKISRYELDDEQISERYAAFNANLYVERGIFKVTERVAGVKSTTDFQTYRYDPYVGAEMLTFENEPLGVLRLCFLGEEFPVAQAAQQAETEEGEGEQAVPSEAQTPAEKQNLLDEAARQRVEAERLSLLHALAHLLYESARVQCNVRTEEVKVHIDRPTDSCSSYSISFIDLTGKNSLFFDCFNAAAIRALFQRADRIIDKCPCPNGSRACLEIEYCNLPDCSDIRNKLEAMRYIGGLLGIDPNQLQLRRRWKLIADTADPDQTGVGHLHASRKNEIEEFARRIWTHKGLIRLNPEFPSRLFSRKELNRLEGVLGICDPMVGEIAYRSGYPEIYLFETIFHERFHNYQASSRGGKRCLHPSLKFFNWDEIDDKRNVPYMGRLVLEGSAVWFSMRMMEFFSTLDHINQMNTQRFIEYFAGLRMFIDVERDYGFGGTLSLLEKGFDIVRYARTYEEVIEEEFNVHQLQTVQNQTGDWLRCLKQKRLLTNPHRVSFYLRGRSVPYGWREGLEQMRGDSAIAHIDFNQVDRLAAMEPGEAEGEGFLANPEVMDVFRTIGMLDGQGKPICAGCPSNCNLFTACMINGGRTHFRRILLAMYPPPALGSLVAIIRRLFRRFLRPQVG